MKYKISNLQKAILVTTGSGWYLFGNTPVINCFRVGEPLFDFLRSSQNFESTFFSSSSSSFVFSCDFLELSTFIQSFGEANLLFLECRSFWIACGSGTFAIHLSLCRTKTKGFVKHTDVTIIIDTTRSEN